MNDPASHYQVHAVMTSGDFNEEERQRLVDNLQASTRIVPMGTIPRYRQLPGLVDKVNHNSKNPEAPKVTPAFDEDDDDAAFPHAIMGSPSSSPQASSGLRGKDDAGQTVEAPAGRSAVGRQMDMRETGRGKRLTGMRTDGYRETSTEEEEDLTIEHPRRRRDTSLADSSSKRSWADSVVDHSLTSPRASFSADFGLGAPDFDLDIGNDDQQKPIKKRRMAMHIPGSVTSEERSYVDEEDGLSLRDMSVDEPRNNRVKQMKKSDLAEKKKSNPRARLFTGTQQCHSCIDTVRVKRECWAVPGLRARCAPCAKAGARCSFMETPPDDQPPDEEEEDYRPRRRGRSIAHGSEASSKLSSLACHLEGYASTLDTLREVLKEHVAHPGNEESSFGLNFVEKKLQKVINEMREKRQEILENGSEGD